MRHLFILILLLSFSIRSVANQCIDMEEAILSARNYSHKELPPDELELLIESLELNQENTEYTSSIVINQWDNGDETADLVVSCDGQVSVFLDCFGECD